MTFSKRSSIGAAAILCVVACKSGDKTAGVEDWSQRPTAERAIQLSDGVTIHAKLPEALKKSEGGRFEGKDKRPSVTVELGTSFIPKSLDEAVKFGLTGSVDAQVTVTRKEKLADGFIVSHHSKDKGYAIARAWRKLGDTAVKCEVYIHAGENKALPQIDRLAGWMESICSSMRK